MSTTIITNDVTIGNNKHGTTTMNEVHQDTDQFGQPGKKGLASYERMSNQYPDSPLFSDYEFQDRGVRSQFYYSAVFGRGSSVEGLSTFESLAATNLHGFSNSGVIGNIKKQSIVDIPDVPKMEDEFNKSQVISIISPYEPAEPIDSMPLTSYYPNTASPSTTLANGTADVQDVSTGPILPTDVYIRKNKQFGTGSPQTPTTATIDIASRMTPSTTFSYEEIQ